MDKHYTIDDTLQGLVSRIQSASRILADFGRLTPGITPYAKAKGHDAATIKSRAFHFSAKQDDTCGKWLSEANISWYLQTWDNEWLRYGPWLGAARDAWFFTGARLLFRKAPGENKRIQACLVEETFYHGPSITPFRLNEEEPTSLAFILTIVNSTLLSWYASLMLPDYAKAVSPKLNLQDIKLLPIPNITLTRHQPFLDLAEQLLTGHCALHAAQARFTTVLAAELGLSTPPSNQQAPAQDWKPWSTALQTKLGRPFTLAEKNEWLQYQQHHHHQQQQAAARQHLAHLDAELDQLVYALYKLTPAEIALVEA
jgi:hypothetical protein